METGFCRYGLYGTVDGRIFLLTLSSKIIFRIFSIDFNAGVQMFSLTIEKLTQYNRD